MTGDPAIRASLMAMLEDVAGPSLDVVAQLLRASSELGDDADLGRRCREIVRAYATARIDQEIARRRPPLAIVPHA